MANERRPLLLLKEPRTDQWFFLSVDSDDAKVDANPHVYAGRAPLLDEVPAEISSTGPTTIECKIGFQVLVIGYEQALLTDVTGAEEKAVPLRLLDVAQHQFTEGDFDVTITPVNEA